MGAVRAFLSVFASVNEVDVCVLLVMRVNRISATLC